MRNRIVNVCCFVFLSLCALQLKADNQTPSVSPVFSEEQLPFRVHLKEADFSLPQGLQSFISATFGGKWLILGGSVNGLLPNNQPPQQNTTVYVIDPLRKIVYSRSLLDPSSGLTQKQIEALSVVDAQFYQDDHTLFVSGGIGLDTASGIVITKDSLTAINIPGLIHWVTVGIQGETVASCIKQAFNPVFSIDGGFLTQNKKNDTLLVLGENNGLYSGQIRLFRINEKSDSLSVHVHKPKPKNPDPDFFRKDFNAVPIIHHVFGIPIPAYLVLGGVFTPSDGVWTVPVLIDLDGKPEMENPFKENTFKQAMNQFKCPGLHVYSKNRKNMYVTLFGGISFGFFDNGNFLTNPQLAFINQITTVSLDKKGDFKQFLMSNSYPFISSTGTNPGSPLLFGAGGQFIPVNNLLAYGNGVIKLDQLKNGLILIGHIVGGIQSSSPSTQNFADTSASPYIFEVYLNHFGKVKSNKYEH